MTYNCFPFNKNLFGPQAENLRQNMWNLWNPICERTIDGHHFIIAEGYIRVDAEGKKRKSYILYKDKDLTVKFISPESAELYVNSGIEGEFNSVQEAKEYVTKFNINLKLAL